MSTWSPSAWPSTSDTPTAVGPPAVPRSDRLTRLLPKRLSV